MSSSLFNERISPRSRHWLIYWAKLRGCACAGNTRRATLSPGILWIQNEELHGDKKNKEGKKLSEQQGGEGGGREVKVFG